MRHITDERELYQLVRTLPLDAYSLAWVAGAHEGEQVRMLLDAYGCKVFAFEPQSEPYKRLSEIERAHPLQVQAFNFGLGIVTDELPMYGTGLGASYEANGSISQYTRMVDVAEFMREHSERVDLFLVNMEGYEYTLLPYLIDTGLIKRFSRLLIQFHNLVPHWSEYHSLCERLPATHTRQWIYKDFLWTLWERV